MSEPIRVHTGSLRQSAQTLKAGNRILLSGVIYTSRDLAHKRFFSLLDQGKPLPYDLQDAVIYYAGVTPAPDGRPIGSCGPTTSGRFDAFAPRLYDLGICATIGKGERSEEVRDAIIRNGGLYLCALGGAGALAAQCVTACETVAFDEFGDEAVKRLEISDFPLIVGLDCFGGSVFV